MSDLPQTDIFEQLYREHAPRVLAFCLRRAPKEVAEDVTAETFTIVWRRRNEIPSNAGPWLFGIAARVLANQRRSARRRDALADRLALESAVASTTAAAEPSPALEALAKLPERDRAVLLLAAWDGLRSDEAAKVLGCSAVAVRVRLHRARRAFARALADVERTATGASSLSTEIEEANA